MGSGERQGGTFRANGLFGLKSHYLNTGSENTLIQVYLGTVHFFSLLSLGRKARYNCIANVIQQSGARP